MADRLRLISFAQNTRPFVERDLNDGTLFSLVGGTLNFKAPAANRGVSQSSRRFGGAHQVSESHANASVEAEWYINGGSANGSMVLMEAFIAQLQRATSDYYVEFRPQNGTFSTYYELRTTGTVNWMYKWAETQATNTLHLQASFEVAPLAIGDTMWIDDDFSRPEEALAAVSTNYVPNPSFEYDTATAAPALWSAAALASWTNAGAVITAQAGIGAVFGTKGMQVVTTSALNLEGATLQLGVLPAGTYTASMYVKGNAGGETLNLGAGPIGGVAALNFAATTTFVRQSVTFASDAVTASTIAIRTQTAAAATWYVDAVQVELGSSASTYFDGDSANTFWMGFTRGQAPSATSGIAPSTGMGDYTASGSGTWQLGGSLDTMSTALQLPASSSRRFMHTAKGYTYSDAESRVRFFTGPVVPTSVKVIARYIDASNYVYAEWSGTTIAVKQVIAGVTTTLSSAGSTAMSINSIYWVELNIVGQVATAGCFSHTSSIAAYSFGPAQRERHTSRSGTTVPIMQTTGSLTNQNPGTTGFEVVVPASGLVTVHEFDAEPFTYRTIGPSLGVLTPNGVIPGTAPAQVDVDFTPSVDQLVAASFGLYSWWKRPALGAPPNIAGITYKPLFGAFAAGDSSSGFLTNLVATTTSSSVNVGSGTGPVWQDTSGTVSGAETYQFGFILDPSQHDSDDFAIGTTFEVWVRLSCSGLTSLLATASWQTTGPITYPAEYGSAGKLLTLPSGAGFKWYRLGTLAAIANPVLVRAQGAMVVTLAAGAGSSGTLQVEQTLIVPTNARACTPSGLADGATVYPQFAPATVGVTKRIYSNLGGGIGTGHPRAGPSQFYQPTTGMSGAPIEVPGGVPFNFAYMFANKIPDTPDTGIETPNNNASATTIGTLQLRPTPRYYVGRAV